jgi:uncharacterized protein (DUF2235 family)
LEAAVHGTLTARRLVASEPAARSWEQDMALYAFDGTGKDDETDQTRDSNVVDFFSAYIDPDKNADPDKEFGSLYLKGIGRMADTSIGSKISEAFGVGGHTRVKQAMKRLKKNMERGDDTIDIVGFSRGAALALSFANRIAKDLPNQTIRFIGVFDVVGQFGLPGPDINAGHVLTLPKNVKCCRHAMALDESRAFFPLTRLCDDKGEPAAALVELWFRGVHSDVGGGNGNRGLNWIALHWMFKNALRAGLPIDSAAVDRNFADHGLPQQISKHDVDLGRKRSFFANDRLHSSVMLVEGIAGRPHNNPSMVLRRMDDEGALVTV